MLTHNENLTLPTRILRFAEGTGIAGWPWRAFGALILAAAIWAGTTLAAEATLETVPPLTHSALRGSVGLLALWLAVRWSRVRVPRPRIATQVGLVGMLDPGLTYILGTVGLALSTAGAAVIIGASEPIFTLLMAAWLLRERISRMALVSLLLAVVGMAVMLVPAQAESATGQDAMLGNLLLILATLAASLYVIATRRMVADDQLDPLVIAALQQTVGVILGLLMLLGAVLGGYETITWAALNPGALMMIVLSGILGDALAFWLFLYGLRRVTAGAASFSMLLVPLFGLGGAALILGEHLHLPQLLGGALVLAAVATVGRR